MFIPGKGKEMVKVASHAIESMGGKVKPRKLRHEESGGEASGGKLKRKRKPSQSNMMLSHLMKQGHSMKEAWAIIKSQR